MNPLTLLDPIVATMRHDALAAQADIHALVKQCSTERDVAVVRETRARARKRVRAAQMRQLELIDVFKQCTAFLNSIKKSPEAQMVLECARFLQEHCPPALEELLVDLPELRPMLRAELAHDENRLVTLVATEDFEGALSLVDAYAPCTFERNGLPHALRAQRMQQLLRGSDPDAALRYGRQVLSDSPPGDLARIFESVLEPNASLAPPTERKLRHWFRSVTGFAGGSSISAMICLSLSAIKTPSCSPSSDQRERCPACHPALTGYVRSVPTMDRSESNLPGDLVLLPTHVVVSLEKLREFTRTNNEDPEEVLVDPVYKTKHDEKSLRRVFCS